MVFIVYHINRKEKHYLHPGPEKCKEVQKRQSQKFTLLKKHTYIFFHKC